MCSLTLTLRSHTQPLFKNQDSVFNCILVNTGIFTKSSLYICDEQFKLIHVNLRFSDDTMKPQTCHEFGTHRCWQRWPPQVRQQQSRQLQRRSSLLLGCGWKQTLNVIHHSQRDASYSDAGVQIIWHLTRTGICFVVVVRAVCGRLVSVTIAISSPTKDAMK